MSFEFERILNHPLAGCTGNDTDDTLLMIRCIERNMNKIANDSNIGPISMETVRYVYREYSPTVLNVENIHMNYFCDAINLAVLRSD